jgi:hypothetical protein
MMRSLLVAPRLRLPLAAAAGALLFLSSCSAGQNAETSQDYNPSDGRNINIPADAGFDDDYLAVRNALIVSDGGPASITVTLINNGTEADLLTEAKIGDQTAVFVGGPVELAPGEPVSIGGGSERIALVEAGGVEPGDWTELTLSFSRAGSTTIEVLVINSSDEYAFPAEEA